LLLVLDNNLGRKAYFVELKGHRIKDGVDQIWETIKTLKGSLAGFVFNARIVHTRIHSPDLQYSNLIKLKKLLKKYKGTFKHQKVQLTEKV
jgi:hypothetical protein